MNGIGKLNFINGDTFMGNFSGNSIDGKGTYLMKNGTIIQGEWVHN